MVKSATHALYAGSFDPITLGHLDIVHQALCTFDQVTIGIGTNPSKKRLFAVEHSITLIQGALEQFLSKEDLQRVTVASYVDKLITDFAVEIGAMHIVRGLRQVSDFNDEFALHGSIEELSPYITVAYFICNHKNLHTSSSKVREIAKYRKPVNRYVTLNVAHALEDKFFVPPEA